MRETLLENLRFRVCQGRVHTPCPQHRGSATRATWPLWPPDSLSGGGQEVLPHPSVSRDPSTPRSQPGSCLHHGPHLRTQRRPAWKPGFWIRLSAEKFNTWRWQKLKRSSSWNAHARNERILFERRKQHLNGSPDIFLLVFSSGRDRVTESQRGHPALVSEALRHYLSWQDCHEAPRTGTEEHNKYRFG